MNKHLLLIIATMVSSTVSAKVTYDDAITSNESYYNQTESVHTTPSMVGLEGFELQTSTNNSDNSLGRWVKVSSKLTHIHRSGAYSSILSPMANGQVCVKGDKGVIMQTHTGSDSGDTSWNFVGYLAECR